MRTRMLAALVIPCVLASVACRKHDSAPTVSNPPEQATAPADPAAPPEREATKDKAPAAEPVAAPLASAAPVDVPRAPSPVATAAGLAKPAAKTAALDDGFRDETRSGVGHGALRSRPVPTAAEGKRDDDAWGATAPTARALVAAPQLSGVKAGEWDDNANYREFQKFLGTAQASFHGVDLRFRRFLVVRDAQGKPIPRCKVRVSDDAQHQTSFVTTASGRALLFPKGEGLVGAKLTASAECAEGSASAEFALANDTDGVVDLHLARERDPIKMATVDLAFVLDTTGSMSEEIAAVTQTIQKVAQQLQTSETRVRVGLVEYKDRTDPFVTKVYPMTQDLRAFAAKVARITASGGGDTPEDMNAGVHDALTKLEWSPESVARMAFVIADAPPHLDYQGPDYAEDMKNASHRGIQLFTVAASGMDAQGQIVMRQMAQYTGATNMFVLRGGAGPQSSGGGDPMSSCGGTQTQYASGNLHELIVAKIKRELRSIDGDPMRIAGLREDENAKPCDRRVVWRD